MKFFIAIIISIFTILPAWEAMGESPPFSEEGRGGRSLYCDLYHVTYSTPEIKVPKPFIGISFEVKSFDSPLPGATCNSNIKVTNVLNGSPAMFAGLKKEDIILKVNNTELCQSGDDIIKSFKRIIKKQQIGSILKMNLQRDADERLSVGVRVRTKPEHRNEEAVHAQIGECGNTDSLIEKELLNKRAYNLFNSLITALDQKSDSIHNLNWIYNSRYNAYQLKETTFALRHPLKAGEAAKLLTHSLTTDSSSGINAAHTLVRAASLVDVQIESEDVSVDLTFSALLKALEEVKGNLLSTFNHLTEEEKDVVYNEALNTFDSDRWNRLLDISFKIDTEKLFLSFYPIFPYLNEENITALRGNIIGQYGIDENFETFEALTSLGKIAIGGLGSDVYYEDYALILDLGGDDIYLNNAGGSRKVLPVSLVIDWDGDDRYLSRENFSQGAGIMGGGFLIDLGGNDTFSSLNGSQGSGFLGIGYLYNRGGKTVFSSGSLSQGVAQTGIGLLHNNDKNTLYRCSEHGQALGLFKGSGIIIDDSGSDIYQLSGVEPDFRDPLKSTISMGQGFGKGFRRDNDKDAISGGIGVLIDKSGDDIYLADYFAQGASYFYGVGIIDDRQGNDQYISGRYSQGAGIHSSIGVLMDKEGNDFYFASYGVAQGLGHDHGIGILEDMSGNDRYMGGTLIQGAATIGGIGIISDLQGEDSYSVKGSGQAYAQDEKCMGIMIDKEPVSDSMNKVEEKSIIRLGFK